MNVILLATIATLLALTLATLIFRIAEVRQRAMTLLAVYAVALAAMIGASFGVPDDLWFLPRELLAESPWIALPAAAFFYSAAFFGGVLQLYNLADRGLSLRILIDVLEGGDNAPTTSDLFTGYSGGRGLSWMYAKRIEGLVDNDLATVSERQMIVTPRGERVARVYALLRRIMNVNRT